MKVRADPIRYLDEGGWRNVDLRLDGISCVPLYGTASIKTITPGAEMHIHPGCIEFCLCIKGNLRYITDAGEYQILPGHLFVSQPTEPHRRCNNPKGMKLHQILFRIPAKGESVLGLTPDESAVLVDRLRSFPFRTCPASPHVSAAFTRLHSISRTEKHGSPLRSLKMKAAALELFVSLADVSKMTPPAKTAVSPRVEALIRRMTEHPEDTYPLQTLAREAALSEVMFTNVFKRATGLTPHAYLLDVRIRHARRDLMSGNARIAEIAARYRFKTARHFSTVFKRIIGMTPGQCRGTRSSGER